MSREAEYAEVFSTLGLTQDQSKQFLDHLQQIHKSAIVAGETMQAHNQSKWEYNKNLKALLAPGQYEEYLSYELSKPAKREVDSFVDYANKLGVGVDDTVKQELVTFFYNSRLSTTERWDGAYDPSPRPFVGADRIAEDVANKLVVLEDGLNKFKAAASGSLQDTVYSTALGYLNSQMTNLQAQYKFFSQGDDAVMRTYEEHAQQMGPK